MKVIFKTLTAFSSCLLIATPLFAQGSPPATPIDGGLSLLLAAGGAYGIKKFRDLKRGKQ